MVSYRSTIIKLLPLYCKHVYNILHYIIVKVIVKAGDFSFNPLAWSKI